MPRVSDEAVARDREASRLRAAARRAANREEYNALMRKYEADNNKHINEQRRLRYGADIGALYDRPFIFWDGEGYSTDDGRHHYMLFGCSYHPDEPIISESLATKTCLDYLLYVESHNRDAFHVGFAFDYDVNMILADLESRFLRHLAVYGVVHWQGYRLQYIPGKMFRVSYGKGEGKITATIEDGFGFFHSKYTSSLLKFGVGDRAKITSIEEGKDKRPHFTFADIRYVKGYWQDEISYGSPLFDRVRDACYDAGFYVNHWYGPGALATYMLRKRGVKKYKSDPDNVPTEAQIAIQTAYAGGRFQPWRCGLYYHPIYTADINSAYIFACSLLPRLDNGKWRRAALPVDRNRIARFGVYRIAFDAGSAKTRDNHLRGAFEEIHPLFNRSRNNQVSWPARTEGWYWSPEAVLVSDNPDARFLEAWIYDDDGSYPFGWVNTEFDKRLALQRDNNPAEKTFKWALAAMYGAFAQRVGWDRKTRKPPPKHELAWAGFITSWCRAEMYRVAYECWRRGGLISIDTDGVTSTVPFEEAWLDRGVGEKLGQWKLETWQGILYWQTGFYWLLDDDGKWSTAKTRGIKRGSLDVDQAFWAMEDCELGYTKHPVIHKEMSRFVGFKEALNHHKPDSARRWVPGSHRAIMGGGSTYKHWPMFCIKCRAPEVDMMHVLTHIPSGDVVSKPHDLPWLRDEPAMPHEDLIIRDSDEVDEL